MVELNLSKIISVLAKLQLQH